MHFSLFLWNQFILAYVIRSVLVLRHIIALRNKSDLRHSSQDMGVLVINQRLFFRFDLATVFKHKSFVISLAVGKSMQKIQIVLKYRLNSNELNFVVLIAILLLIFLTKIVHSSIFCKHHLSISNFHQV